MTLVAIVVGGTVASSPASAAQAPTCMGKKATIVGTAGSDRLKGTSHADVIVGGGGNDHIDGGGGADLICGGTGNDTLGGGTGKDHIDAGPGNDTLIGGTGKDKMRGGNGIDTVSYATARSAVSVSLSSGKATCAEGTDSLSEMENITGGAGSDVLVGSSGPNRIDGGAGNDQITAGGGNDSLIGGAGKDKVRGGGGIDTASYATARSAVSVSLSSGKATGAAGTDSLSEMENITGGAGSDVLVGSSGPNRIDGGGGNDQITAGGGNDSLIGGAGNDYLAGDPGNDHLSGGTGNDSMTGGAGSDYLDGGTGANWCDRDLSESAVRACRYDESAPELVSVQIPSSVRAGQQVTIRWRVTDATGVNFSNLQFSGPAGQTPTELDAAHQVSGTATDAIFEQTVLVHASALTGTYGIHVNTGDAAGNNRRWTWDQPDATYTVTGGTNDAAAPELVSVQIPSSVRAGQQVTIRWRVTDATGVNFSNLQFSGPAGQTPTELDAAHQVSGTATDAIFEQTVLVHASALTGTYGIHVNTGDAAGNNRRWTWDQPDATYTVTGGTNDAAAPELVSVQIPSSVRAGQQVTIRWRVTDATGVNFSNLQFSGPAGQTPTELDAAHQVSGTATDAVFEQTVLVHASALTGTYGIHVNTGDAAGNNRRWTWDQPDATYTVTD